MFIGFKKWMEDQDFDEILPRPVMVHGKMVNTKGQMDKALAAHSWDLKGAAEFDQWDQHLDPHVGALRKILRIAIPDRNDLYNFRAAAKDPIGYRIIRPLFNPNVTVSDVEEAVVELKRMKLMGGKPPPGDATTPGGKPVSAPAATTV